MTEDNRKEATLRMLIGGEFQTPSGKGDIQQTIVRRQFLIVASELYQVTAELRDQVLPLYRTRDDKAATALREWRDRFRLGQPWVLQQVKETLDFWTLFSPKIAQLDKPNPPWHPLFQIVARRSRPEITVPFEFAYQTEVFNVTAKGILARMVSAGWDLELERKEQFIAEARRQFESALRAYCSRQELAAEQRGLVRVKRSRTRNYSLLSKVRWSVHRNCGQMSFDQIAQEHRNFAKQDVDSSIIGKEVREISSLIELDGNPV
jgi:hypothetical protein